MNYNLFIVPNYQLKTNSDRLLKKIICLRQSLKKELVCVPIFFFQIIVIMFTFFDKINALI